MKFRSVIIILLLISCPVLALEGWSTAGTNVGNLYCIDVSRINENYLYAGNNNSFYRSMDEGLHWERTVEGSYTSVQSSKTSPEVIYTGSYHYFIRVSEDHGKTFFEFDLNTTNPSHSQSIVINPTNAHEAFIGTATGIYRVYKDGGQWLGPERIFSQSWKQFSHMDMLIFADDTDLLYTATSANGGQEGVFVLRRQPGEWEIVHTALEPDPDDSIKSMCPGPVGSAIIYCGTFKGYVYRTDRTFSSWDQLPEIPGQAMDTNVRNILFSEFADPKLIIETECRVFEFFDDQWVSLNSPVFQGIHYGAIGENPFNGNLVCSSSHGTHVYIRKLNTWQVRNRGITEVDLDYTCFHPSNELEVFVSTSGLGVFKSTDGGETWIQSNNGLPGLSIKHLQRDPNDVNTLFAAYLDGLAVSYDNGSKWEKTGEIPGQGTLDNVYTFAVIDFNGTTEIIAGTFFPGEAFGAIYLSEDGGLSFTEIASPSESGAINTIEQDLWNPDIIYVGLEDPSNRGRLWKSADRGRTFQDWTPDGVVLGQSNRIPKEIVQHPTDSQLMWIVVSKGGAFKSSDGGNSFYLGENSAGPYWTNMCLSTGNPDIMCMSAGQVQRPWPELLISDDLGETWHWSGQFERQMMIKNVQADPYTDRIWVLRTNGEIVESRDQASNWDLVSRYFISLPFQVNDVVVNPQDPQIIFVASEGHGVWKSEDSGWSWFPVNDGLPQNYRYVRCIDTDNNVTDRLMIGCTDAIETEQRVYETNNAAARWGRKDASSSFNAAIVDMQIVDLQASDTNVWLVTYGNGPFLSTDGGVNWEQKPINPAPPGLFLTSVTHTDYSGENNEPWIFASSHGGGGTFVWDSQSGFFIEKSNGLPGGSDKYVDFVAADPERYGVFWAVTTQGLYKTQDFGENWAPAFRIDAREKEDIIPRSSGLTFHNGDLFYFDRTAGVWRTQSGFQGEEHWKHLNIGMDESDRENLTVIAAAGAEEKRNLFAGTSRILHLAYPLSTTMKDLGVDLKQSPVKLFPGDNFSLSAVITNPGPDEYSGVPLFVLLEVYGMFFWWPTWAEDVDLAVMDIPVGLTTVNLLEFIWPDLASHGDLRFYSAMTNSQATSLLGNMDWSVLGW